MPTTHTIGTGFYHGTGYVTYALTVGFSTIPFVYGLQRQESDLETAKFFTVD